MKSLIPEEKYMVIFVDFFMFLDTLEETLYVSSYMQVSGPQLCFINTKYDEKRVKMAQKMGVE
jgi:hypothetical protein